jgi:hypothetical protein
LRGDRRQGESRLAADDVPVINHRPPDEAARVIAGAIAPSAEFARRLAPGITVSVLVTFTQRC